MFMNEYDVQDAVRLFLPDEVPNLAAGAKMLHDLMEWTNRNSDGWVYWTKPQNAAKRITDLLYEREYAARYGHDREGKPLTDITEDDLDLALRPIKAFLTRQGVSLAEVFAA